MSQTGIGYDPGRAHAADRSNEDFYALPNKVPPETRAQLGALYVVADGMGGHAGGEVAAQATVNTLFELYYSDTSPDRAEALRGAMIAANQAVYQLGQGQGQERMGSTVAAAVIRGNELIVGNVGDSRVYLLRGGGIQQLSQDHTWVAERVAAGDLTEAEARAHPQRNILLRSLGAKPDVQPFVAQPLQLAQGDRVLLCSDGLWEPVDDATIAQIVNGHGPGAAARMLVNAANARGGHDNITALVVPIGQVGTSVADTVAELARWPPFPYIAIGLGAVAILLLACALSRVFSQVVSLPLAVTATTVVRQTDTPTVAPSAIPVAQQTALSSSAPSVTRRASAEVSVTPSATPGPSTATLVAEPSPISLTIVPNNPCGEYPPGCQMLIQIDNLGIGKFLYSRAGNQRSGICTIPDGSIVAVTGYDLGWPRVSVYRKNLMACVSQPKCSAEGLCLDYYISPIGGFHTVP
jgi:protein phosphatase